MHDLNTCPPEQPDSSDVPAAELTSAAGLSPEAAAGEAAALAAAVAALVRIGAEALAERENRGDQWGTWADWCYTQQIPALPADRDDVARWADTADLPESDIAAVLAAIEAVHRSSGWDLTFSDLT